MDVSMTESISPFAIPPVPDRYRDGDNRLIKALATEQIMDAAVASHALRALAHGTNTAASLEWRVRSYLSAN